MTRKLTSFKSYPFYILLLPLFFVLHGYFEYYALVPASEALKLAGIYMGVTLLFFLLFLAVYRNLASAALAVFIIMAVNFFFGAFHDLLKKLFPGSFITRYAILLPVLLFLVIVSLVLIKKRNWPLLKTTFYLNILFILLLFLDGGLLMDKIIHYNKQIPPAAGNEFSKCDDCSKPDIYLVLADEYAGKKELEDIFSFNNEKFLQALNDRQFHIIDSSHSNYNLTIFSTASTLNSLHAEHELYNS